jgi:hypothetical protein
MPANRHMPSPRQAALLVLQLVDELRRERETVTRARLGEFTLLRLWNRPRLREDFLAEVQDWLLLAGWALFDAGSTYGVIRIDAVENWASVSSKRLQDTLDQVVEGTYEWHKLDGLIDRGALEERTSTSTSKAMSGPLKKSRPAHERRANEPAPAKAASASPGSKGRKVSATGVRRAKKLTP